MAKDPDPTKDPKFQQVVKHFLTTPPRPHKPKKKRESDSTDSRQRSGQKIDKNRKRPKDRG